MRVSQFVIASVIVAASSTAHAQRSGASSSSAASALAAFNRGIDLYDRHDYSTALESFRASYNAAPSPNSRLYIARCLREIGDIANALSEFHGTIDDASARARTEARYVPTRDAATQELREMQARLGSIRVDAASLPADARVRVDGREVSGAALAQPIYVAPGHIAVNVDASGYQSYTNTLMTTAGQESSVRPVLVAVSAPSSGGGGGSSGPIRTPLAGRTLDPTYRNIAIASAGVGVVGFIGLIAFGVAANSTYADIQMRCGNGPCSEGDRGAVATGQTFDTLANVGLAVGIVGILAGGAFLYWSYRTGTRQEVTVGSNGTSIFVGGRF